MFGCRAAISESVDLGTPAQKNDELQMRPNAPLVPLGANSMGPSQTTQGLFFLHYTIPSALHVPLDIRRNNGFMSERWVRVWPQAIRYLLFVVGSLTKPLNAQRANTVAISGVKNQLPSFDRPSHDA